MRKKGLSVLEYAILIGVIVAALLTMQSYVRKAISGGWRKAADSIGFGMQYDPNTNPEPSPPAEPPPTLPDDACGISCSGTCTYSGELDVPCFTSCYGHCKCAEVCNTYSSPGKELCLANCPSS